MKRQRKKYKTPTRPWDKQRIEREREMLKTYGLRNKRELWRAFSLLRKYRAMARDLAAKKDKETEKNLVKKLVMLGLLNANANLDDVLGLTSEKILDRRLQTVLLKKGLVNTINQSRQLIVHRKVLINGRKVVYPSYLVSVDEENNIRVLMQVKPKETKEVVK